MAERHYFFSRCLRKYFGASEDPKTLARFLLRKLGRPEEARAEFERAASLTGNVRERELLQKRAAECAAERMAG